MQLSSLPRLSLALALLCFGQQLAAQTQTKTSTGTISGRVTVAEKPAQGVTVLALPDHNSSQPRANAQAKTDAEGRYRLTGLPAGSFKIYAAAREYVSAGEDWRAYPPGRSVTLSAGEQLEEQNLALERGGVITGRVTDTTGRPLIEETIRLFRLGGGGRKTQYNQPFGLIPKTDDRGIYRIYGLPAGRYLVAAGFDEGESQNAGQRRAYKLTYHPATAEETQAKVIEVTPGSEATDVDIKLGASARTQTITVRLVEAESGRPVPNQRVVYGRFAPGQTNILPEKASREVTDNKGETQLESVLPGSYAVYVWSSVSVSEAEFYCEPQPFEVSEGRSDRVELTVQRGARLSGVIAFEGVNDSALLAQVKMLRLWLMRQGRPTTPQPSFGYPITLAPDLSFRSGGVPPGKYQLSVSGNNTLRGVTLARIERNGSLLRDVELSDGEQLYGLRLVLVYGRAVVRGQVQVIGGTLPANVRFLITARNLDNSSASGRAEADARGQFVLEFLTAGTYEVTAYPVTYSDAPAPGAPPPFRPQPVKQQIIVGNTGETQVTLTLDLTPKEGRR